MPRGGFHIHAERWGRKKHWVSASDTKPIRVPEELVEQVLEFAHQLDEGKMSYVTKAKSAPVGDKTDSVTKAKEEKSVGTARELLVRIAWKLTRIAKGDDPNNPHPGKPRKVSERIEAVVEEIKQWLDEAK